MNRFRTNLLLVGVLNFPLVWLCLGGIFRSYICLAFGFLALFLLYRRGGLRRLKSYTPYFLVGAFFVICAFLLPSETEAISAPQFFDLFFYAIPTGVLLAHYAERKVVITCLNWIYPSILLVLGIWGWLFIGQVDLSRAVVLTGAGVMRDNTNQSVDLFGLFHYENVIIQIIPFSLYSISASPALFCKAPLAQRGVIIAAIVLGAYVSGAVLTRTPFFAGGITSAGLLIYLITHSTRTGRFRMLFLLLLIGLCLVAAIQALPGLNEMLSGLQDRLSETTRDSRQFVWEESLRLCFQNPLGGGDKLLSEHFWAHDVVLDMGLLYGIPGLLAMIALLVRLSASIRTWLARIDPDTEVAHIIMVGMFFAALIAALISPPDLAYMTPMLFIGTYASERLRLKRRAAAPARIHPVESSLGQEHAHVPG